RGHGVGRPGLRLPRPRHAREPRARGRRHGPRRRARHPGHPQAARSAHLRSDRLIVEASAEVTAALETHSELIAGETLATSLEFGSAEGAAQVFDPDELPEGTRLAVSRA